MKIFLPFWISLILWIIVSLIIRRSFFKERNECLLSGKNTDGLFACNFLPWLASLFIVTLFSLIIWSSFCVIYDINTKHYESFSIKHELIAIKNKEINESKSSWNFFVIVGVGSSESKTEPYYFYYVNYPNGIQLEKRSVFDKSIFIRENLNKDAYIEECWTKQKHSDILVNYFCYDKYSNFSKKVEILNIPVGTINREMKISL